MRLLAIESSGPDSSAALVWSGGEGGVTGPPQQKETGGKGQADRLIGLVDRLLDDAGCPYAQIDLIAVGTGPGSFTGIRTAVAAARGLALAMDRPVLPVTTLEALASAAAMPAPTPLLAILDARRGEIYVQPFTPDRAAAGPASAASPAEVAASVRTCCWLIGMGAPLLTTHLDPALIAGVDPIPPDARGVARAAEAQLARGVEPVAGFAVRPLYLREPDARPMRPSWPMPGHAAMTPARGGP